MKSYTRILKRQRNELLEKVLQHPGNEMEGLDLLRVYDGFKIEDQIKLLQRLKYILDQGLKLKSLQKTTNRFFDWRNNFVLTYKLKCRKCREVIGITECPIKNPTDPVNFYNREKRMCAFCSHFSAGS